MDKKISPRIIIIGAGVAGMQAGSILDLKGFDVTILEAKSTYGGRVRSDYKFCNEPLELGGEEVHGELSPHLKIVKECGGKLVDWDQYDDYYEIDGKIKNEEEIKNDPDVKKAWKIMDDLESYSPKKPDMSLFDYLESIKLPKRVWLMFESVLAREWGSSMDKLSIKGMCNFEKKYNHGSKNYLIRNLSQMEIFEKKFAKVLGKIKLNTPVISVDYNIKDKIIRLTDKSGQTYDCEIVIITIPISVLKKNIIKFNPPLPSDKLQAIDALEMDDGSKLIMKFTKKFWKDDMSSLSINGILGHLWPSRKPNPSNYGVLTSLITGSYAREIAKMTHEEIKNLIFKDLGTLFGPVVEESYLDHVLINWGEEEYIWGAYSYPSLKESDKPYREVLCQDIEGMIHFAGEAINPNNFSSIGSALESATIVAKKITSKFKL